MGFVKANVCLLSVITSAQISWMHKTVKYVENTYFLLVSFITKLVKLREVTKCCLVIVMAAKDSCLSVNAVSHKFA